VDWQGQEASLECVVLLQEYVPKDENDVIPYCLHVIRHLPGDEPLFHSTASKMNGSYAVWIAAHQDLLEPFLPYLSQDLRKAGCASAAAFAINEICNLAEPVLQLYQELQQPNDGTVIELLNPNVVVTEGEVIDASYMGVRALQEFHEQVIHDAKESELLLSIHRAEAITTVVPSEWLIRSQRTDNKTLR
jgi:Monomeric isocitrate dehydrogenase